MSYRICEGNRKITPMKLFNDGILPKIIITTVMNNDVDARYANAGYDEVLE